jgi:hypothetical protein
MVARPARGADHAHHKDTAMTIAITGANGQLSCLVTAQLMSKVPAGSGRPLVNEST